MSSASSGASSRAVAWPALLGYLAAFVLTLCASAILVFTVALERAAGQASLVAAEATHFALSPPGLIAVPFVDAAVLLAVALAAERFGGRRGWPGWRLGAARAPRRELAAIVFGMIGLSFACGAIADLAGLRDGGVMDTVAQTLRSPTPSRFVLALGAIAIAPALAEETFFRGFMQPRLVAAWGRWPGILVTSAGFALMHLEWVQSSLAFFAGIFLGWTATRAGGIRPTILAHAINNGLFVTLAAFGSDAATSKASAASALAIGAIVWAGATWLLRRATRVQARSSEGGALSMDQGGG